jgi:hypothetical protein
MHNAPTIESEVMRRTSGIKGTAWVLWFFLGGFNAHLAYLYPKDRVAIVGGTLAFGFLGWVTTLLLFPPIGFLWPMLWPVMWMLNWIPLVTAGPYNNYRRHLHAQLVAESSLPRQFSN